jgi:hypothetical protein
MISRAFPKRQHMSLDYGHSLVHVFNEFESVDASRQVSLTLTHTVPKAAHISEKYLGVYMGASPLAGKFPKAV